MPRKIQQNSGKGHVAALDTPTEERAARPALRELRRIARALRRQRPVPAGACDRLWLALDEYRHAVERAA